jgi:hypothetical protein
MARLIGGVVLGYVAMVAVVFAGLTGAWFAIGADRAFQPGGFDVSPLWAGISILVAFAAALLGGRVSRAIAQRPLGPRVLAGLVVVLGVAMALAAMAAAPAEVAARTAGTPMFDAIQAARTPMWIQLLTPFLGAVGVLLGGRALGAAAEPRSVPPGVVAG